MTPRKAARWNNFKITLFFFEKISLWTRGSALDFFQNKVPSEISIRNKYIEIDKSSKMYFFSKDSVVDPWVRVGFFRKQSSVRDPHQKLETDIEIDQSKTRCLFSKDWVVDLWVCDGFFQKQVTVTKRLRTTTHACHPVVKRLQSVFIQQVICGKLNLVCHIDSDNLFFTVAGAHLTIAQFSLDINKCLCAHARVHSS